MIKSHKILNKVNGCSPQSHENMWHGEKFAAKDALATEDITLNT